MGGPRSSGSSTAAGGIPAGYMSPAPTPAAAPSPAPTPAAAPAAAPSRPASPTPVSGLTKESINSRPAFYVEALSSTSSRLELVPKDAYTIDDSLWQMHNVLAGRGYHPDVRMGPDWLPGGRNRRGGLEGGETYVNDAGREIRMTWHRDANRIWINEVR